MRGISLCVGASLVCASLWLTQISLLRDFVPDAAGIVHSHPKDLQDGLMAYPYEKDLQESEVFPPTLYKWQLPHLYTQEPCSQLGWTLAPFGGDAAFADPLLTVPGTGPKGVGSTGGGPAAR